MPARISKESLRKTQTVAWDERLIADIKVIKPEGQSYSDYTQELVVESLERRHPDFREYAAFRRQRLSQASGD